jgi:hypothetical protein
MCKTAHEVRSYSLLSVKKLADGMNMMKGCTSVTDRNQKRRKKTPLRLFRKASRRM